MHGEYLLLLLGSLASVVVLDHWGQLGIFRQGRRLLAALLPATLVVLAWDLLGVARWGWSSNRAYLLGPYGLGGRIPLEEFVFPVVVGACAIVIWALLGARGRRRDER